MLLSLGYHSGLPREALNPVTSVLTRAHTEKEGGNRTTEAKIAMMQTQFKDFHQPPEDRRYKNQIGPHSVD